MFDRLQSQVGELQRAKGHRYAKVQPYIAIQVHVELEQGTILKKMRMIAY